MTTWLWIIGIAVWPVIVAFYLERRIDDRIQINFTRYGTMHERMDKAAENEISNLQAIVEQQDAHIALLWYKAFGLGHSEDYGRAELMEFFHSRPGWYLNAMESPGFYDTLCRYEDFPWGKDAEWLRREAVRD